MHLYQKKKKAEIWQHLVSHPWSFQDDQFELLEFFVSELDLDFTAEDPG